jgi:hypothetical protein
MRAKGQAAKGQAAEARAVVVSRERARCGKSAVPRCDRSGS